MAQRQCFCALITLRDILIESLKSLHRYDSCPLNCTMSLRLNGDETKNIMKVDALIKSLDFMNTLKFMTLFPIMELHKRAFHTDFSLKKKLRCLYPNFL
jgi:hypothetical protein